MTRHDHSTWRVAVIAFDGMTPFHLSVPCLVFGGRPGADARSRFALTVCGAGSASPLATSAGFGIVPGHGLEAL
ncbi:GlxA family transcriptional regulator, partial [Massilia sp. CT11-108]